MEIVIYPLMQEILQEEMLLAGMEGGNESISLEQWSQPMGRNPFGGQTSLSQGSHIMCTAYQIFIL